MAATGNPVTYTYVNVGTHTVTVTASDGSTTKTAAWPITITQGGPPGPASTFTVSGATFSSGRWQAGVGQPITFTATEAHAQAWDWNFGDGDTASGQTVTHVFTRVGSPNVTVQVTGDGTNTVGQNAGAAGFTVFDPTTLAVGTDGRYQIQVTWASAQEHKSGTGTAVTLTSDSGYFWFFNPANIEVIVKVLDACNVDGFTWVFAGGLTSLEVQITVTDTLTGATKTYDNSEGAGVPADSGHAFRAVHRKLHDRRRGRHGCFGHAHAVDADARNGSVGRFHRPRLELHRVGQLRLVLRRRDLLPVLRPADGHDGNRVPHVRRAGDVRRRGDGHIGKPERQRERQRDGVRRGPRCPLGRLYDPDRRHAGLRERSVDCADQPAGYVHGAGDARRIRGPGTSATARPIPAPPSRTRSPKSATPP